MLSTATDPRQLDQRANLNSPADGQEFRFSLDHPVVIEGAVPQPVNGRLAIEGWAVARSGIEAIDVFFDGQLLGQAYYGTARRDVEAAFPGWTDAFHSGYIFHVPPRVLESGSHDMRLQVEGEGRGKLILNSASTYSRARISTITRLFVVICPARRPISTTTSLIGWGAVRTFGLMLAIAGPLASEKFTAHYSLLGGSDLPQLAVVHRCRWSTCVRICWKSPTAKVRVNMSSSRPRTLPTAS